MINSNIDKIKSVISKHGLFKSLNMLVDGKNIIKQIYINNPSEYLNQFNNLIIHNDISSNKIIYFNDNNIPILSYEPNNKTIYVNYHLIWSFYEEIFNIEYIQIQSILMKWLEQSHNLIGYKPDYEFY